MYSVFIWFLFVIFFKNIWFPIVKLYIDMVSMYSILYELTFYETFKDMLMCKPLANYMYKGSGKHFIKVYIQMTEGKILYNTWILIVHWLTARHALDLCNIKMFVMVILHWKHGKICDKSTYLQTKYSTVYYLWTTQVVYYNVELSQPADLYLICYHGN